MSVEMIPSLIKQLYGIVNELETMFPGRKFTPDGHLVGSIGEVLAAYHYGLQLLDNSYERHDAKTKDNRLVQIKITQGTSVAIRSQPDYLIVMKLNEDGSVSEIYNGPGQIPWEQAGKMQKNGQRPLSLSRLKLLNDAVSKTDRIQGTIELRS
jgi:hypothetical protein